MSKKKHKSGAYASKRRKKKGSGLLVGLLAALVVLLAALIVLMLYLLPENASPEGPETSGAQTTAATQVATVPSEPTQTEVPATTEPTKEIGGNLGYGIYLTDIAGYTGMYMEDGSDEILSGILMLVVENIGEQDIQYAELTLDLGETLAEFTLTTLPVGEKMVLLEQNRMTFDPDTDYAACLPSVGSIAYFQEPLNVYEDKLKLQIQNGAINITNISGEDIPGTIVVYYKNAAADIYYGGITYCVTLEGGLKADEIRQIMTNHASDTGSRIMFVTISQ